MPNLLTLRIIGDRDEGVLEEFTFYPGETRSLTVQFFDEDNEQKHSLPTDITSLTVTISGTPDDLVLVGPSGTIVIDTIDRSLVSISLTPTNTTAMITGSIELSYVSTSRGTRKAKLEFATKKILNMS